MFGRSRSSAALLVVVLALSAVVETATVQGDHDSLDLGSLIQSAKPDDEPSMAYSPTLANNFIKNLVHSTVSKMGLPFKSFSSATQQHAQHAAHSDEEDRETKLKRELKTMSMEESSLESKEHSKLRGSPCAKLKEEEEKEKAPKCSPEEGTGRGADDEDSDPRDDDEAGQLEDESAVDALDNEASTIGKEIRKLKEERKVTEAKEEEEEHEEELAVLRDDAQKRREEDEKILVERDEKEKALLDNKLADLQLQKARDEREAQKEEMAAEQAAEERRVKRDEDKVETLKHSQEVAKEELTKEATEAEKAGENLTPAEEAALSPAEVGAEMEAKKEAGMSILEGNSTMSSNCAGQPCIQQVKEEMSKQFEERLKQEEEAMNKKMSQLESQLKGKELESEEVEEAKEAFGDKATTQEEKDEVKDNEEKASDKNNRQKEIDSLSGSIAKDIEDNTVRDNGKAEPEKAKKAAAELAKKEVLAAECAKDPSDPACADADSPEETSDEVSKAVEDEAEKEAEETGGGVDECNPPKGEDEDDKKCKKRPRPNADNKTANSTAPATPEALAADADANDGPDADMTAEIKKGENEPPTKEVYEAIMIVKRFVLAALASNGHGQVKSYAPDVEDAIKDIAKEMVKASITDKSLDDIKKGDPDMADALNEKERSENTKAEIDVQSEAEQLASGCSVTSSGVVISHEDLSKAKASHDIEETNKTMSATDAAAVDAEATAEAEGKPAVGDARHAADSGEDAAQTQAEAEAQSSSEMDTQQAAEGPAEEAAREDAEAAEAEKEAEASTANAEKKAADVSSIQQTVENAILRNIAHAGQLKPGGGEEVSTLAKEIAGKISSGEVTPEAERMLVSSAVDRLKDFVIQLDPHSAAQHFGLNSTGKTAGEKEGEGEGDGNKAEGKKPHDEEKSLENVADEVEKKIEEEGERDIVQRLKSAKPAEKVATDDAAAAGDVAPAAGAATKGKETASSEEEPAVKAPINVHDVPEGIIAGAAQALLGGDPSVHGAAMADGVGGAGTKAAGSSRPPLDQVEKKIEESIASRSDIPVEKKKQVEDIAKMVAGIEHNAHHAALGTNPN